MACILETLMEASALFRSLAVAATYDHARHSVLDLQRRAAWCSRLMILRGMVFVTYDAAQHGACDL